MERHEEREKAGEGGSWQSAPRRSKMKDKKQPGAAEWQSETETGLASRGSLESKHPFLPVKSSQVFFVNYLPSMVSVSEL